jgi:hypothetical protein
MPHDMEVSPQLALKMGRNRAILFSNPGTELFCYLFLEALSPTKDQLVAKFHDSSNMGMS